MLAFLRDRLQRRTAQSAAEAAYWAADTAAREAHAELGRTVDPQRRARHLRTLADRELDMAQQFHAAFGPDAIPGEGRDMTISLGHSAHLLFLLHCIEYAISINRGRYADGSDLDHAAEMVLDEMAATPDLMDRMRLLERLYDVVEPLVGGQAAETVACLPAPGMRGWETL